MIKYGILLVLIFLTGGCASTHTYSGYLDQPALLEEGEFFKQQYVVPSASFARYRKVQVRPVTLEYLSDREGHEYADLEALARIFRTTLEEKLGERFAVLDPKETPGTDTLIVEAALVHVDSPKRVLNAVTALVIYTPLTGGSAAFEAKVRDGAGGGTLIEVAEKQTAGKDFKSLTVGAYTKYDHAKAAFAVWGEHLRKLLESRLV